MSSRVKAVVIGAGISGLAAAFFLRRAGADVTVLEKDAEPGGTMKTYADGGWLVETGPNSALETTPLFTTMLEGLDIAEEKLYADPMSEKRFILRDGQLHLLPTSAWTFLRSSLWTARGKARLLKEPFVGRADREETVAEFVERRLGREFLDYAINPFVAGVYAGSPERLSVRAAFPKLHGLEVTYGGLVRGMIGGARERKRRAEKSKDRAKMFSFRHGMQTLPLAVGRLLGEHLRTNCAVTEVGRNPSGGFRVVGNAPGGKVEHDADAVIIAVPSNASERFVRPFSATLADALTAIDYPPVAEVFLGYSADAMTMPLQGFGYLIPAREGRKTLGTLWSSSLFPGRAPSGHVALTTFVGGSRQPDLARLDDKDLLQLVADDLGSIMRVKGSPVYSRVIRWEKAIPQYNIGYLSIIDAIEKFERDFPGLFLCSNFRGGIAVGDCVSSGEKIAARVAGIRPPTASA